MIFLPAGFEPVYCLFFLDFQLKSSLQINYQVRILKLKISRSYDRVGGRELFATKHLFTTYFQLFFKTQFLANRNLSKLKPQKT